MKLMKLIYGCLNKPSKIIFLPGVQTTGKPRKFCNLNTKAQGQDAGRGDSGC